MQSRTFTVQRDGSCPPTASRAARLLINTSRTAEGDRSGSINISGSQITGQLTAGHSTRTARYVRLDVTAPANDGDNAARIYEFEVYGAGGAASNLALNRPATLVAPGAADSTTHAMNTNGRYRPSCGQVGDPVPPVGDA